MELSQKKDVIMKDIHKSFSGLEIQLTLGKSNRQGTKENSST